MTIDPIASAPAIAGAGSVVPRRASARPPGRRRPGARCGRRRSDPAKRVLTDGPYVRRFEEEAADYLGVRHCVAVSSCTAGLMLVLRASELSGDVIVPSFTFAATAHAVEWNGLRPSFADIDPGPLTLVPGVRSSRRSACTRRRSSRRISTARRATSRVCATSRSANGLRLFFDAAHAFGSQRTAARRWAGSATPRCSASRRRRSSSPPKAA